MTLLLISVLLALTWAAITGTFSLGNLILGFVIGGASLWIIRLQVGQAKLLRKIPKILTLAFMFLYELIMSAIRVLILVLSPNMNKKLHPAIIAFPLTAKSDPEITLLANLITLTPGTLSVDVAPDRSCIYVHALDVQDKKQMIADIANGFEAKIIEVFK